MPIYEKVEPGSLDINEVDLRLGGIVIDSPNRLFLASKDYSQWGNKFVIAEHHVDVHGSIVEAKQFDARRMSYSLFVSPIPNNGRHYEVIPYQQRVEVDERLGETVGGGIIRFPATNRIEVADYSSDYKREPAYLRAQFAQLLLKEVSSQFHANDLDVTEKTANETGFYGHDVNVYWLRYKQVLEAAEEQLTFCEFYEQLEWYNEDQKRLAKNS